MFTSKTPSARPGPSSRGLAHGARNALPGRLGPKAQTAGEQLVRHEVDQVDDESMVGTAPTPVPAPSTLAGVQRVLAVLGEVLWTVLLTLALLVWRACGVLVRRRADILHDVVLVTNAGRGIGRRLAVRFGLEAGLVVCWDPDIDRCMNTVYEVRHRGGAALGFAVDAADEASVVAGAAVLRRDVGQVHIVVLNTGRLPLRPLLRFTVSDLHDLFRDNVFAHFVLLKVLVPPMVLHNKGHVVFISSASSILPSAMEGPYVATKRAVDGMMCALREELSALPHNRVRVSCVYPYLPLRRSHEGATYELQWGRLTVDRLARQIVTDVLLGCETISVPRCLVFWMRLLRLFPLNVRRRWRRLFLRRACSSTPVPRSGLWVPECLLESWVGTSPATRSIPPYEMATERSSSGNILPIGFRRACKIELP